MENYNDGMEMEMTPSEAKTKLAEPYVLNWREIGGMG